MCTVQYQRLCVSVVIVNCVACICGWKQKAITRFCCNSKLPRVNACQYCIFIRAFMRACVGTCGRCVHVFIWQDERILSHYILHMSCMHKWMDGYCEFRLLSICAPRASVLLGEWLFNLRCSTRQSLSFYSNHPAILGKTVLFLCWVCCTGSVERRMARVHKMLIVHWPENWLQARLGCGWLLLAMLDITHTHLHTTGCMQAKYTEHWHNTSPAMFLLFS